MTPSNALSTSLSHAIGPHNAKELFEAIGNAGDHAETIGWLKAGQDDHYQQLAEASIHLARLYDMLGHTTERLDQIENRQVLFARHCAHEEISISEWRRAFPDVFKEEDSVASRG